MAHQLTFLSRAGGADRAGRAGSDHPPPILSLSSPCPQPSLPSLPPLPSPQTGQDLKDGGETSSSTVECALRAAAEDLQQLLASFELTVSEVAVDANNMEQVMLAFLPMWVPFEHESTDLTIIKLACDLRVQETHLLIIHNDKIADPLQALAPNPNPHPNPHPNPNPNPTLTLTLTRPLTGTRS